MSAVVILRTPAFYTSFLKGILPSAGVLLVFFLWAWGQGTSHQMALLNALPSVVVPVSQIEAAAFAEAQTSPPSEHTVPSHHVEPQPALHHGEKVSHDEGNRQHEIQEMGHDEHVSSHDGEASHGQDHTQAQTHEKFYEEGLVEQSEYGLLPRPRASNGLTPFDAYRHKITGHPSKTFRLAIGPLGLSKEVAEQVAEKIPAEVSIILSPYAQDLDAVRGVFQQSGHEVWLQLPMESKDTGRVDSGPLSLRADYDLSQNDQLYKRLMGATSGYTGLFLSNPQGTTVTLSSVRMQSLLGDLFDRGLGLAYVAPEEIKSLDALVKAHRGALRHVVMLNAPFSENKDILAAQLATGANIDVTMPLYPGEIDSFAVWLRDLPQKGYTLIPLSF